MIEQVYLGALYALSAVLLLLVLLAVGAVVWLWRVFAKFRQLKLERVEKQVHFYGSVDEG